MEAAIDLPYNEKAEAWGLGEEAILTKSEVKLGLKPSQAGIRTHSLTCLCPGPQEKFI